MPSTKILCLSDNLAPSEKGYWAEHGLAFYIESEGMKVLFDTGQSGDVLLHNAGLAGVSLRGLDYVVLSHGHYDHTGGLLKVLKMNEGVSVIVHPAVFRKKAAERSNGLKDIGLPFDINELRRHCELRIERGPVDIGHGISTTGEVRRNTPFEVLQPGLLAEMGGGLFPDPVPDDQSLIVHTNREILLLCGCCHAGIVNTIECVKRLHGHYPGVIAGGLHLEKASPERIALTIEALRAAGIKKVVAGHCSGNGLVSSLCSAGFDARHLTAGTMIGP